MEKYQKSLAEQQLELEHSTKVGASSMAKFKRAVASARALAARNSKSSVVAPELPPIPVAKEVDAAPEASKSSSEGAHTGPLLSPPKSQSTSGNMGEADAGAVQAAEGAFDKGSWIRIAHEETTADKLWSRRDRCGSKQRSESFALPGLS